MNIKDLILQHHDSSDEIAMSVLREFERYRAVYSCPTDDQGRWRGPLAACAGKGNDGENLVSPYYLNFARIETDSTALYRVAKAVLERIKKDLRVFHTFDVYCGIPSGGQTLAQALCAGTGTHKFLYLQKSPIPTPQGKKQEYEWNLDRFAGQFPNGTRCMVVDDLTNNFNNTDQVLCDIQRAGMIPVGIACAICRSPNPEHRTHYTPKSGPFAGKQIPIYTGINIPLEEYEQSDPKVQGYLQGPGSDNQIEFSVKARWNHLLSLMDNDSGSSE